MPSSPYSLASQRKTTWRISGKAEPLEPTTPAALHGLHDYAIPAISLPFSFVRTVNVCYNLSLGRPLKKEMLPDNLDRDRLIEQSRDALFGFLNTEADLGRTLASLAKSHIDDPEHYEGAKQ